MAIGREYRDYKKDYCERPGCTTTIEHTCQLDVHHRDGNHANNDPSNFQTLCSTCHRLVTHQITNLPYGLQKDVMYALGLSDGTCPVGMITGGDTNGVTIELFNFWLMMTDLPEVWISTSIIICHCKGFRRVFHDHYEERPIWDMDPLADFQTQWKSQHFQIATSEQ